MKRLNDQELTVRINNFLTRKFEELGMEEVPAHSHMGHSVRIAREGRDVFRTTPRFSLRWHHA